MISLIDVLLAAAALPGTGGVALSCGAGRAGSPPAAARAGRAASPLRHRRARARRGERDRQTVASLLAIDYPRELFRVLVVADNCSDRTASRRPPRARRCSFAGCGASRQRLRARVRVRHEPRRRLRGRRRGRRCRYASCRRISCRHSRRDSNAGPRPSRRTTAFATRGRRGARGLMTIALAAFHGVRSVARERLGAVVRVARQRHGVLQGTARTRIRRGVLDRRGSGIRDSTGLCRRSRRVRARGASARSHGGDRGRLAFAAAPLGARTARRSFAQHVPRSARAGLAPARRNASSTWRSI